MTDENEKMLKEQKDKTQTLLQILLHGISNRVQSISLLNRKARMGDTNLPVDSHLASHLEIDKNLGTLHGVLHSVRRMHVLELEKKKISPSLWEKLRVISWPIPTSWNNRFQERL